MQKEIEEILKEHERLLEINAYPAEGWRVWWQSKLTSLLLKQLDGVVKFVEKTMDFEVTSIQENIEAGMTLNEAKMVFENAVMYKNALTDVLNYLHHQRELLTKEK